MSAKAIEVIGKSVLHWDGSCDFPYAADVLAALKAARIAVVELPESSEIRPLGDTSFAIHTLSVVDKDTEEIKTVDVTIRVSAQLGIASIAEINSDKGLRALAASILAHAEAVTS